jgi:serine phosphatase RsbU (regulator of sigma subunit)
MRSCKLIIIVLILVFGSSAYSYAQKFGQPRIDSLMSVLSNTVEDSVKVKLLNDISFTYWNVNPQEGLRCAKAALKLANKINSKKDIAESYTCMSNCYRRLTILSKAIEYGFKAVKIFDSLQDKSGLARMYVTIGNTYRVQGEHEKAMKYLLMALKLNKANGDLIWTARNLNSIGNYYLSRKDFEQAKSYYNQSLAIGMQIQNEDRIASALTNLAGANLQLNYYEESINQSKKAIEEFKKIGENIGVSECYKNIGMAYYLLVKNNNNILLQKLFGGDKTKAIYNAVTYCDSAIVLDTKTGHLEGLQGDYEVKSTINYFKGNFEASLIDYKKFIQLKDSVFNLDNNQKINELEKSMEEDLKQKEIEIQKLQIASANRQKWYLLFGLAFLAIIAFVLFNLFRQRNKSNILISAQKLEVEKKGKIIEHKNLEITESIQYAQRIQFAILPTKEHIAKAFNQSFILFKPKDIVSGDFYWFQEIGNKKYIAACDCTGHGVPGALMSMVATDMLNDALVHTKKVDEILAHTNRSIKTALKQSADDDSTRDGMDIALCCFDEQNKMLKYAGAYRPLWLIRNSAPSEMAENKYELIEYKATKAAIGGLTEDNQIFQLNEIELQKGDTIYLSSDGFADQFSPADKKLMTKRFKEILLSIQHLSMSEQEKYLDKFITDWRGNMEQTDDVLVIGVRV